MKKVARLIVSIIICEVVGIAGAVFTTSAIPTWYATLEKPSFAPPNWVFGPVWTILYLLMGVSAYLIWNHGLKKREVRSALVLFDVQLILNFLWSLLFFGLQMPWVAAIEIILLLTTIIVVIYRFGKISQTAARLMIPYALWVSFATVLNISFAVLN